MIISIHIPKTAGTSLLHYLRRHFNVYEDYKHPLLLKAFYDRYPNNLGIGHKKWMKIGIIESLLHTPGLIAKTKHYNCIHGHFSIKKYKFYPNSKFITFVREPYERMVSNYYFWKQVYESGNPERDQYLDYMFKEKMMTLNKFLFNKNFKNYQFNYLNGLKLDKLDFMGISDDAYFPEDVTYLFRNILKCPLEDSEIERLNKSHYRESAVDIDMDAFRAFHKKDYEIYDYAVSRRKRRL